LARGELVEGSLYRTLSDRGLRLRWAQQHISAASASVEQAGWLDVMPGYPLMVMTRVAYGDEPQPIEYARSWTRPEFPVVMRLDA
jgi:GntR family transcriptional regulator